MITEYIPSPCLHPAYAAGILDGEGTLFIANSSGKCFFPCIQVGMTDIQIPRMFHEKYGGYLTQRKHYGDNPRKDQWADAHYWRIQRADLTMAVLRDVWLYLVLKKPQAAVIISMLASAPNRRAGRRPVTDEELQIRCNARDLTRALNKRGPHEELHPLDQSRLEDAMLLAEHIMSNEQQ